MWNVADGEHLTVLGNTVNNISIRPCAFFDDNVTVASAQMEGKVTVSVCVCVPGFRFTVWLSIIRVGAKYFRKYLSKVQVLSENTQVQVQVHVHSLGT